jgi:hypothetical protein
MLPSSSPIRSPGESPYSPPQSSFHPDLPAIASREPIRLPAPRFTRTTFTPVEHNRSLDESDDELNLVDNDDNHGVQEEPIAEVSENEKEDHDIGDDDIYSATDTQDEQNAAISGRIAQGGEPAVRLPSPPEEPKPVSLVRRLLYAIIALGTCSTVLNFKFESSPIGYCDTGRNTNDALEQLRSQRGAIEACNRENRNLLFLPPLSVDSPKAGEAGEGNGGVDMSPCPLPSLLPLPHPDTCTPCPEHATCTQYSVTCDVGFLLRPHPLGFFLQAVPSTQNLLLSSSSSPSEFTWKLLSGFLDGVPGLGSVALPPRCIEDPKRKRNIGALGKAIESYLGQERGHRLCIGSAEETLPDADGGESRRWGIAVSDLRDTMRKKTKVGLCLVPPFQIFIIFQGTSSELFR